LNEAGRGFARQIEIFQKPLNPNQNLARNGVT